MLRLDAAEDRGADKETVCRRRLLKNACALMFAEFDILFDLQLGCGIDYRTNEIARILRRTDPETSRGFHKPFENNIVNVLEQDQARCGGTLLALISERRLDDMR